MEHDDRREIFERLEALERLARSRSEGRGGRDEHRRGGRDRHDHGRHDRDHGRHDHGRHDHDRDDRGRGRGDGEFQEKRIIDTIVQLVGERLERFIQDQQAKTQRRDDDGSEKRVVDLVVRLVGEHVGEIVQGIVSTELDRRLGPQGGERPRNPPPHGDPEPE
jgi:hypothetical protein